MDDPGYVDIYPTIRIPKRLHHLGRPIYRPAGLPRLGLDMKEKGYRLGLDPVSLSSILQWASDAEVRFFIC